MRYTKNGNEYDFKIDEAALMEKEAEDPKFNILDAIDKFSECPRLTDLYMLAKIIGWDYKEFVAAGFNIQDLLTIYPECIKEIGFFISTDAEPAQQEPAA